MPAPYNPRRISDHDLAALQRSIRFFGTVEPIVCNRRSNRIIGGHQRVRAAQAEGLEEFPVVWVDLDEPSEKQLNLALNRISGDWDDEKLRAVLAELNAEGADLALTGFDDTELENLLAAMTETPQGGVEPAPILPPTDPTTRPGDTWHLGDHDLICADCRDPAAVDSLVGGAEVHLAITSPPYASQREYDQSSEFEPIPPDKYVDWFEAVAENVAAHLGPDGSWFVNLKEHCEDGQRHLYVKDLTLAHVRRWGWWFVDEFIWTHGGTPKTPKQRFKNGWEPIFQFSRGRHKFRPGAVMHQTDDVPDWGGLHPNMEDVQEHGCTEGMRRKGVDSRRKQEQSNAKSRGLGLYNGGIPDDLRGGMAYPSNVLSLGKNREAVGHPAAYPLTLPAFFLRAFSDRGDRVFDPFMGSGSTLMAAENLGRKALGCEISPGYCDVIVTRWEQFTGKTATVEHADG